MWVVFFSRDVGNRAAKISGIESTLLKPRIKFRFKGRFHLGKPRATSGLSKSADLNIIWYFRFKNLKL